MSSEPRTGPGLWDRLTGGGRSFGNALHCWVGDGYQEFGWETVVREAEATTAGLRRAGVRPGTRVAAVLTNSPHVVRGLLGVWLAGGAVASLPVPARGMTFEEYAGQLAAIADRLDPVVFLVEANLLAALPESLRSQFPFRSWESFADSGRVEATPPELDEPAFIQYSSGSTSTPKGCVLSPRAIAAQLDIIADLIDARPGRDVFCSWLPLSHDMGLFGGLLSSWANDFSLYLSTPERFTITPNSWFADMAEFGGRSSAGTNTSLYLAARAARRTKRMPAGGLGSVEHCIIGAERIEWETLRFAAESMAPFGLRPNGLVPAYGLAEATLAVSYMPDGAEPWRRVVMDAAALADAELVEVELGHPHAASVVSAGTACQGVELIDSGSGRLDEIVVRSPSLATGYWADEQRSAETFRDGLLHTSDLGFVKDGHLYPVGRTDDVISIAGRKVYAREVESVVDGIDGVRRGCSTLVAHHDGTAQRLTLFIEVSGVGTDYGDVATAAASVAMAKAAVALDECVFLDRDSLPKTPTGKIQRHRCRNLFEAGRFEPLATVDLTRM
ncbi:AMP-binding protein [Nocardia sp. CDC159]|uniref:AMP-binding protein n=1 Tax=Nocardia pulmonis TaxID=2951408 RepID=A0A9X2EIU0_9NOCA|nr:MULTISPECIES: AMP-binding protein [Nocardia]MCM6779023.1 AMP-binding protein [Nocardia pulmonis]MCM6791913.1 AMP-binding protein [Nocardia sp. CDC159]